ncbi:hypothetical protein ACFQDG_05600 [Natronoarchaeum mannanilyticum]|uniref:Uncharacterized protein n=1 Tax=Natronoarchaeum mannanilyticum TaxID=926360 RepID=A0AAV3TCX2_9EURY
MSDAEAGSNDDRLIGSRAGNAALGIAYLLIGVGLAYSLAVNSIDLFGAVLVGIIGLVALSLAILVRREGLFAPENKLIGIFVLLAMALLFGLSELTELPSEIVFGVVFAVGVVVPHLLLEYTEYGTAK